jgi:hypothetical protein
MFQHPIEEDSPPSFLISKLEVLVLIGVALVVIGLVALVGGSFERPDWDCSHPVYTANYTRNLEIMKYCTGGEKEVQ